MSIPKVQQGGPSPNVRDTSRIVLKRQLGLEIYYFTFPFTVDFEVIRQHGRVSSSGNLGAPGNTISILFRPFNSQNARGEARPEDVIINLERPGRGQICLGV